MHDHQGNGVHHRNTVQLWKECGGWWSKGFPSTKTAPWPLICPGSPSTPHLRSLCSWSSCCSWYTLHLCLRAFALAIPESTSRMTHFHQSSPERSSTQEGLHWPLSKFLTLSFPCLRPCFTFLHCTCHLKWKCLFICAHVYCRLPLTSTFRVAVHHDLPSR